MRAPAPLAALLLASLAGCLGAPSPEVLEPTEASPACRDPRPCADGSEWPLGLEGPFPLDRIEHLRLPNAGVELDGWLLFPRLPPGVRAPAVLHSTPYLGFQEAFPDDPRWLDEDFFLPVRDLLEAGHVLAVFSLRGTGNSGGCHDYVGPSQHADQAFLVEWLAAQPWSNGRVGMIGFSYPSVMPWMAAVQQPEALKAIVVGGTFPDLYQLFATPQGALAGLAEDAEFAATLPAFPFLPPGVLPPGAPPQALAAHPLVLPQRLCDGNDDASERVARAHLEDDRSPAFWAERRLSDRFADVRAAVLLTQGFAELPLLQFQDDALWQGLAGPKRFVLGPWGHTFPGPNVAFPENPVKDWDAQVVAWFDHWLKGLGPAPADRVDFLDSAGVWRASAAWPPPEARPEVLHLRDGALAPAPGTGSARLRAAPAPGGDHPAATPFVWVAAAEDARGAAVLCPPPSPEPTSLVFATEPLAAPAQLAGNPFALLALRSDEPRGVVSAHLFDLGPAFACDGAAARDARRLASGAADLRFHDGDLVAEPFPVGRRAEVRLDLPNLAHALAPDHRLALALARGDPGRRDAAPPYPGLDVLFGEDGSHLVLPLLEGTLGGAPPARGYPPRPFAPPPI